MTFDGRRRSVVCFGGRIPERGPIRATNGIWERTGTNWTSPPAQPLAFPRFIQSISKDPSGPNLLAISGDTGSSPPTGLWAFDGFGWQGPRTLAMGFNEQSPAMTLDEFHAVAVAFGGRLPSAPMEPPTLDDRLWKYDGNAWAGPFTQANGPGPRSGHVLAFMNNIQATMMFGGFTRTPQNSMTPMTDSWIWKGGEWAPVPVANTPVIQFPYAGVYQARRQKVLIAGNVAAPDQPIGVASTTWEFDGHDWTRRDVAHPLPPLTGLQLAYDEGRNVAVLVGASAYGGASPQARLDAAASGGMTWEWDGIDWHQKFDDNGLPVRAPAGQNTLAYSVVRKQVLCFVRDHNGWLVNETWGWDGSAWTKQ
jgi:hypothetical protein